MSEISKKIPGRFPAIGTSPEQREFVYGVLLGEMKRRGMIEAESHAELQRWAIVEASKQVGLTPVIVEKRTPGRKPEL